MQLHMDKKFLEKDNCLYQAEKIYKQLSMTKQQVAEEIYAHAIMYYKSDKLPNTIRNFFKKHCNIIDLEVGGDTFSRREIYRLIWIWNTAK